MDLGNHADWICFQDYGLCVWIHFDVLFNIFFNVFGETASEMLIKLWKKEFTFEVDHVAKLTCKLRLVWMRVNERDSMKQDEQRALGCSLFYTVCDTSCKNSSYTDMISIASAALCLSFCNTFGIVTSCLRVKWHRINDIW